MNNIQEFLEEEMLRLHDNYSAFKTDDKETRDRIENYKKWWQDHDTRIINFILGEVEREVENEKYVWESVGYAYLEPILKAINNLRIENHPFNELHITNCEKCREEGK